MGARIFGGIVMMIFGLLFVLYGGKNPELLENLKYSLVILGDLLWIFGGLALYFGTSSKTGKAWVGGLLVIVALLAFLFFTGDVPILMKYGILVICVTTLIGAITLLIGAGLIPAPGQSFPMGSPQNIPPKMPVPEKKKESEQQ